MSSTQKNITIHNFGAHIFLMLSLFTIFYTKIVLMPRIQKISKQIARCPHLKKYKKLTKEIVRMLSVQKYQKLTKQIIATFYTKLSQF